MTPEKVLQVTGAYRQLFQDLRVEKIDYPHEEILDTQEHGLAHCHGMLSRLDALVLEGRMEKAFRWLGFIQGVLWTAGVFPLESLKNHNRPDGETALEPGWLQNDIKQAVVRARN